MSGQGINNTKMLIEAKKKTLEETQLYLAKEEEQAAIYGINIPPKMQLEMELLQKKIENIQNEIIELEKKEQSLIKNDIDRELVPKAEQYHKREEHRVKTIGIVYLVVIPILATVFILTDIIVIYPKLQVPVIFEQVIDSGYHHLGDNTYSEEYMQSISGDKIKNLSPEGLSYSINFDLSAVRQAARVDSRAALNSMDISMYVNQLKPRTTAPVVIGLNGEYVAHLNNYVKAEEFRREKITIPVNVPIYDGQNEIEIVVGKDTEQSIAGFDEYEDFEFDSLAITVHFDEKHLRPLPFWGIVIVEIFILGLMGRKLSTIVG